MSKEQFEKIYKENITRAGSDKLFAWLESSDFFKAPASSKYHLSVAGGLCQHSINVYNRLTELCNTYYKGVYSNETIAIASLLHDLCKVNFYKQDWKNQKTYDIEKVSAAYPGNVKRDNGGSFIWETVPFYTIEEDLIFGHGEKSVYIIQSFMKLTRDEATAIRWHMGPWNDGEKNNVSNAFEKYPLAMMTHMADMMATYMDEAKTNG